jgi:hypothetical protein
VYGHEIFKTIEYIGVCSFKASARKEVGCEFRTPAASLPVKYVNLVPGYKAEKCQTSSGHDLNTPAVRRAPLNQHVTLTLLSASTAHSQIETVSKFTALPFDTSHTEL